MVLTGSGRFYRQQKSRSLIHVSQNLVSDSQFPFDDKAELVITIDPKTHALVIRAAHASAPTPGHKPRRPRLA